MADEHEARTQAAFAKIMHGLGDLIELTDADPKDWPHPNGPDGPAEVPLTFDTVDADGHPMLNFAGTLKVHVPLTRFELATAIRKSLERKP